jgi:hypothetical protein
MTTLPTGIVVPDGDKPWSLIADLRKMGLTGNRIPSVNSQSEAQAIVDALASTGYPATTDNPVYVRRADLGGSLATHDGARWVLLTSDAAILTTPIGDNGDNLGATPGTTVAISATADVKYPIIDIRASANRLYLQGSAAGFLKIVIDGTTLPDTVRIYQASVSQSNVTSPEWRWRTRVSHGSHTIQLQLSADPASAQTIYLDGARLQVQHG